MNAFFATLILSTAVAASVALGIFVAWIVLQVLFGIFARPAKAAEDPRPRLELVTPQARAAHAGGD